MSFMIYIYVLSILFGTCTVVHSSLPGMVTGIQRGGMYEGELSEAAMMLAINVTDFACGLNSLCDSSQGRMEYPGSCFRCQPCRCDDQCHHYGDCCNDEFTRSTKLHNPTPDHITCLPRLQQHPMLKGIHHNTGVLQVTKCPTIAQSPHPTTVHQCENPNLTRLMEALPVWSASSQMMYRNKFCALCHDVFDYKYWNVSAKCNTSNAFAGLSSLKEIWQEAWGSSECSVTSLPPLESTIRPCWFGANVNSCQIVENETWESKTIARLCEEITNPVQFNRTMYKNIYCALCNGVSLDRSQVCKIPEVHSRTPPVPPLSVLLNFYPKHSDEPSADFQEEGTCQEDHIYSRLLGQCFLAECPPRYMYSRGTCQPVFQSCAGLGYRLQFTLFPDKPLDLPSTGYLIRKYERDLRRRLDSFKPFVFTPLTLAVVGHRFFTPVKRVRVQSMAVSIQIVSSSTESVPDLEQALANITSQPWALVKDEVSATFLPILTENDSLDNGQVLDLVTKNDSRNVFGKKCLRQNCLSMVEFLEFSDVLRCPFVRIKGSRYGFSNMTFFLDNKSFILNDGMYIDLEDELQLCVSELERISSLNRRQESHNSWKAAFSTICLAVSDLCLLLTFIVYSCLPSLRTLPGKNTMSLVFHLFWAQFLYLCGVNATANENLCQVLGVVIHYMWLASFFWMFICAYHMYTIFSNLLSNSNCVTRERNDRRLFTHYCLFANLAPLVLVISCICYFLGRTGGHQIGYGGELCFLNSMGAVGIFFASPLLLILLFNLFFFIRTVLSIRRTPDVLSHNCANRNYAAIYFRLSLLLGFGWVFGFFPSITVIFCLFSIFTGGQGVFIFASFCLNRRVLVLLSQKFRCSWCHLFTAVNSNTKSTDTE